MCCNCSYIVTTCQDACVCSKCRREFLQARVPFHAVNAILLPSMLGFLSMLESCTLWPKNLLHVNTSPDVT
eukprot:1156524-Pelagomonas_calceolata.AAC.9